MNPLNHVAIIMDGNGRWGLAKKNSRNFGHKEGLRTVEKIIQSSINENIKYLTLYVFSIDNWKRPKNETEYLFSLLESFLKKKISQINSKNIKLCFLGNKKFPTKLNRLIKFCEKKTMFNDKLQVNLALNYGSKEEIVQTIKLLNKRKIKISKENISNNLFTKNMPDPDILIRTGNTKRLSNFLLWQISYSEIFFERKLWPDFNKKDFEEIIKIYKKTKRNYGNI